MFNLNLPSAKNLAKAISSGSTSSGQEEHHQKGGWFRSASSSLEVGGGGGPPTVMHARTRSSDFEYDQEGQNCDPLIYRLQHQKQYHEDKDKNSLSRSSERLRRRKSERGKSRVRDPFDLSESLTSEEASSQKPNIHDSDDDDKSNVSDVDVVGWDSKSHNSRRSSSSRRSNNLIDSDEEDGDGLVVDFGGVTPDMGNKRSQSNGKSDAIHFSDPQPSAYSSPQIRQANGQNSRPRYPPKRTNSESSKISYLSICDEIGGDDLTSCPSHADLANILSSLEKESLSLESAQQNKFSSRLSCTSTLGSASPTDKYRQSLLIPPSLTSENLHDPSAPSTKPSLNPPLSSHPQHADQQQDQRKQHSPLPQPSPRQQPSPSTPILQQPREEEDDPRLVQLRQQTTEELKLELSSMQAQSKSNLEKSWAETERLRVENSELDDELVDAKKKLAVKNAAMLSGGGFAAEHPPQQDRRVAGERQRRRTLTSSFIIPKFCTPSQLSRSMFKSDDGSISDADLDEDLQFKRLHRPTTAKSLYVNVPEKTELDSLLEPWSSTSVVEGAKAPFPNKRNRRAGAARFQSITSGCSVGSGSDFGLGFAVDDDDEDDIRSRDTECHANDEKEQEFDDRICNALLSIPATQASTLHDGKDANNDLHEDGNVCDRDDDSTGAESGAFYPRPDLDDDSSDARSDDDSSGAESGVFYPRPDLDDDSSDARSGVFYPVQSVPLDCPRSLADMSSVDNDSRSGVFYPPPTEDEEVNRSNPQSHSLVDSSSVGASEMDDFDFDPLKTSVETDQGKNNKSASEKPKDRRGRYVRRPSFMSLFDAKAHEDTDDEDSIISSAPPPPQKEHRAAIIKSLILKKDNAIESLAKSVRTQEEDIRMCEADIAQANVKCGESEKHVKDEETKLQQKIKELVQIDSEIESKLDSAESSEQKVREKEHCLKEQLAMMGENREEKDCEYELENHLSLCQQQYDTSQENAIESLSGLLTRCDAMCIPSLRGDIEDHVSGDIISRFDDLTDKEEELVKVLSDPERLALCQASFRQIQNNIEKAMFWKKQLGSLEADLRSRLVTIKMLMGDEGTHTTESSTASERVAIERVFVEAIISHLESVKQNQGKLVLDALSKNVEFLTHWDQLLLPDFSSSPSSSISFSGDVGTVASTISILKSVAKKAESELAAVKSAVLNEEAKFQARMQSEGLLNRRNDILDNCNVVNTADDDSYYDESEQRLTRETEVEAEDINKQISRQISAAEMILSERESLIKKYSSEFHSMSAHAQESNANLQLFDEIFGEDSEKEVEELERQISTATSILSERESLMNKYSSDLDLMQDQAREESRANLQLTSELQMKIKHILAKLAEEKTLIASLERSLQLKKEKVCELESRL